ncbi:hypothetical protein CDL12_18439 [Handroanthus impetiginosus]|uniref:RING-type E3 ubiquitin transferase n=1 Tax=Handroanthus impetiginosus TaxID=429701 RepID=A0A2G9GUM5_9LAMI|nr:hypothetical protein CDL12_18439 [Handroanthus impetiginosus]
MKQEVLNARILCKIVSRWKTPKYVWFIRFLIVLILIIYINIGPNQQQQEQETVDIPPRLDFVSSSRLSEDTIMKNLKTRSSFDLNRAEDDDDEDERCIVCQDCLSEGEDKIATLDCGHEYHVGCIKKVVDEEESLSTL